VGRENGSRLDETQAVTSTPATSDVRIGGTIVLAYAVWNQWSR